jgi:hypothetical protein
MQHLRLTAAIALKRSDFHITKRRDGCEMRPGTAIVAFEVRGLDIIVCGSLGHSGIP